MKKQDYVMENLGEGYLVSTAENKDFLILGLGKRYETIVFPVYGDLNDPSDGWVDYGDELFIRYADTEEEALKNHEEAFHKFYHAV